MKESSSESLKDVEQSNSITQAHLQSLLLVALCLSAMLLFSALLVATRTVHQIERNTPSEPRRDDFGDWSNRQAS